MSERLEEIKKRYANNVYIGGRLVGKTVFSEDMTYLFRQVERVEELEKYRHHDLEQMGKLATKTDELKEEKLRYRKIIEDVRDVMEYLRIDMMDEQDTLKGIDNILKEHYSSEV